MTNVVTTLIIGALVSYITYSKYIEIRKNKIIKCFYIYRILLLRMSGDSAVANKFDAAAMAAQCREWEKELNDELELENVLTQNSDTILSDAREQYSATKDFVEDQLDQRLKLRKQLAEKIASNKKLESEIADYQEFVNSDEYKEYCQNLRDIAALDADIRDLLIKENRLGRPPVELSEQAPVEESQAEAPDAQAEAQEESTSVVGDGVVQL